MSLVARHLESNGIVTVVIGSAIDVVSYCGTPRYLHTDFPLGNPCGKPYDKAMQAAITLQALQLAIKASAPNTVHRTPFIWSEDNSWRDNYARVDDSNRDHLLKLGESRRQQQTTKKAQGITRAPMLSVD